MKFFFICLILVIKAPNANFWIRLSFWLLWGEITRKAQIRSNIEYFVRKSPF